MIADLDETIRQILIEEMPIKNGEIDIKFDQPTREWSSRLTKPTVSFFLYDVRENNVLRQHQWQRAPNGNGRDHNLAHLKRTPVRVDCHYMLTTWAAEPDDEHRLLTRSILALFRHPVLPEDKLTGSLQNPLFDIQASIARHDKLTNPAEVWSSLDNELRPSISYVITLALDPWTEVSGPAVRTMTLHTGQADALPHQWRHEDGTTTTTATLGGIITSKSVPQSGIDIAIKGTGFVTASDAEGRYTLGGVPPGDYTLIAWPPKGKPREKKISIPAANYDINL